jgi:hypothetical protein
MFIIQKLIKPLCCYCKVQQLDDVIFVKQQDYIQTVIGNEKVYGKNVVFS